MSIVVTVDNITGWPAIVDPATRVLTGFQVARISRSRNQSIDANEWSYTVFNADGTKDAVILTGHFDGVAPAVGDWLVSDSEAGWVRVFSADDMIAASLV